MCQLSTCVHSLFLRLVCKRPIVPGLVSPRISCQSSIGHSSFFIRCRDYELYCKMRRSAPLSRTVHSLPGVVLPIIFSLMFFPQKMRLRYIFICKGYEGRKQYLTLQHRATQPLSTFLLTMSCASDISAPSTTRLLYVRSSFGPTVLPNS